MKRVINRDQFLELYNRHQEFLKEGMTDAYKRLVWDFEIDFEFSFDFTLDLSYADLVGANLSRANLDYSCLPLWCGAKNMILCDNLQAQLLGHIIDACKSVNFTEEQKRFVRDNWSRTKEFLGEGF